MISKHWCAHSSQEMLLWFLFGSNSSVHANSCILPRFRTAALWCWSKESFSSYVLTTQSSIVEHEMTHREPLAKPRQGAMQGRLTLGALSIPPDLWRIYAWKTDHIISFTKIVQLHLQLGHLEVDRCSTCPCSKEATISENDNIIWKVRFHLLIVLNGMLWT